jgi:hypothetical protein
MVLYPEVQRKAQAEIDALVGKDRLPDFSDRPLLPYVSAVLEEALRWHPVVPLGTRHNSSCARLHIFDIAFIFIFYLFSPSWPLAIPHKLTTDDWYEGWFLPAGTLVIGNSW